MAQAMATNHVLAALGWRSWTAVIVTATTACVRGEAIDSLNNQGVP